MAALASFSNLARCLLAVVFLGLAKATRQPAEEVATPNSSSNDTASSGGALDHWQALVFGQLPCYDDARFSSAGITLYGKYRLPGPEQLDYSAHAVLTWPGFSAQIVRYLALSQAQLQPTSRWPLDGEAASRRVRALFDGEPVMPFVQKLLVPAGSTVAVFGDLHGAVHSFLRELASLRAQGFLDGDLRVPARRNFYMVFCGDYVDRGFYGAEVLSLLLTLKLNNPDNVFMARGNHEDANMNQPDAGGSFEEELRLKFGSVASAADLGLVWQVYETLPLAIFIGVLPDTPAAAAAGAGGTCARPGGGVADAAAAAACADGAAAYLMAVHGGIEMGYDPQRFLHGTAAAAAAAADAGNGGGGEVAVVQFALIHALRRADWLATRAPDVAQRVPAAERRLLQNYGSDPVGRAAFLPTNASQEPPAASRPYPVDILGTDPANGFLWFDFFVHDEKPFLKHQRGRGFVLGKDLVRHWLRANGVAAILRAHQHNDSPAAGPMLSSMRAGGGMHDNWAGAGMVLTFLSGGHVPVLDYPFDAFGLLTLGGQAPSSWSLQLCSHRSGDQYVRAGGEWAAGREPPHAGPESPGHVCNADISKFACSPHAWRRPRFDEDGGDHDPAH